jgi:hypothetical protein
MKTHPTTCLFRALITTSLVAPLCHAAVVQTNTGTGNGSIPGGTFVTTGNLLATHLDSATRSGSFYRETSGYTVNLNRMFDGQLGPMGSSGLGNDGAYTVMPDIAVLQFNLSAAFNLTSIRTYASWDLGRSGQGYVVKYATTADPSTFNTLATVTNFNNDTSIFPLQESYDPFTMERTYTRNTDQSSTLITLTSNSGPLAQDVVALQFIFNGYQNGGTAFREFQVTGSQAASAVPEPSLMLATALLAAGGLSLRRRFRPLC